MTALFLCLGDEISESSLPEQYNLDSQNPENQHELAEEFLAYHAESMSKALRADIEGTELSRWRKFLRKVRNQLEKILPKSYAQKLDDRVLTKIIADSLRPLGFEVGDLKNFGRNTEVNSDDARFAFSDNEGNIIQEFGVRNSQLTDNTVINVVAVNTDQHTSTDDNPDEAKQHHLRTADADTELRRRIDVAAAQNKKYTVHNDDSQMTAEVSKNDTGEMRHRFKYSTVPGYVYAAAMVNIEPLFKDAKLCLSHDDRYSVQNDGSVKPSEVKQTHRFFAIMEYEGKKYAVKLTVKENTDGHNNLYSLQTHETEIAEIKAAPADETPTGGGVESANADQSKINFGQIKDLFDLPSNYHNATKITLISEKSRQEAEEKIRFLKKNQKNTRFSADDGASMDEDFIDRASEVMLVHVNKAGGDLSDVFEHAQDILDAAGFPKVNERQARFIVLTAKEKLDQLRYHKNYQKAFEHYRETHPLFDFVMDFVGENGYVNPGKRFEGLEVTGTFFDPNYKRYNTRRKQGAKESDASYRRYLAKRIEKLKHVRGKKKAPEKDPARWELLSDNSHR